MIAEARATRLTTVRVHDEIRTTFVLDTGVVVEDRGVRSHHHLPAASAVVARDRRPSLVPGTRVFVEGGSVCLCPPLGEPDCERRPFANALRRTVRQVEVEGDPSALWLLLRGLDGRTAVEQILAAVPAELQDEAVALLAQLVAGGVVTLSDRPTAAFLHASTKKGTLPGGEVDSRGALRMVTDGGYRTYPDAERFALADAVPESLAAFHRLTRTRRSFRNYDGSPIARSELDALLNTACGPTGVHTWEEQSVALRAYPSSGGLYAVEIYPLLLAVDGMVPGVYHLRPAERLLERVRPLERQTLLEAALPEERGMIDGVAAVLCLTGNFRRHERKYGEGGYRMLVAEAGHISQNLILSATALGLHARPWGGAFDRMLNAALGIEADGEDEQFLLSVIVGHSGRGR
jgi:SagB-type dehydrogenase family enzyme